MRMHRPTALLFALLFLLIAGCTSAPAANTKPAESGAAASSKPAEKSPATEPVKAATVAASTPEKPAPWPRQVKDASGNLIEIKTKPMRVHTLSVGYDEISMALIGSERFAAVGSVTANPLYSNIVPQAEKVAKKVGRKSEDILAAKPDLVVASPFANKDLVAQLKEAGLTVVVSNLQDSMEGHAENIRFLAHLYGEEERGEALIKEVNERLARLEARIGKRSDAERPKVISLTEKLNTPGKGTTMDGIINRAGGINAAAAAGIEKWQLITLEKVVELRPDVILVTEAQPGKKDFGSELLAHPSLQSVPAIKNRRVYAMPGRLISTLSHWNVRGAEELARLLWPAEFKDVQFADFK